MPVVIVKKKRREYKLEDLTRDDFDLLKQAYFLHQNDPTAFLCFGKFFPKLKALKLVDDENQLTYEGRGFVKYYIQKFESQWN